MISGCRGRQGAVVALTVGIMLAPIAVMAAPLMQHTFEENDGGWQTFGDNAKVSVTHDANNVKEGKGALQFNYNVTKGELNAAVLPTPDGALTGMKSIRFWVKSDSSAPLGIGMQEKDEGRYVALFSVPKDKWQEVQLSLDDFTLSQNANDPKDPDNKLDLEKVEGIGLVDLSQLFAQSDNADLAKLLNVKTGAHTLYLDNFIVSIDPLPAVPAPANGDVPLDTFSRPQLSWLFIGDTRVSQSTGKPLEGSALQADYRQAPGKIVGWIKPVRPGRLAGMTQLVFNAASTKNAKLLVQVEETSGGKYNTVVSIPDGSQAKEVRVNFADFTQADDSHDDDNKLDLAQVKQVLFADASGLVDNVDQDNTLWIGSLRVVPVNK